MSGRAAVARQPEGGTTREGGAGGALRGRRDQRARQSGQHRRLCRSRRRACRRACTLVTSRRACRGVYVLVKQRYDTGGGGRCANVLRFIPLSPPYIWTPQRRYSAWNLEIPTCLRGRDPKTRPERLLKRRKTWRNSPSLPSRCSRKAREVKRGRRPLRTRRRAHGRPTLTCGRTRPLRKTRSAAACRGAAAWRWS